jgi:hypothetical protein
MGIEAKRELRRVFKPLNLLTVFNGLNTLNTLNDLVPDAPPLPLSSPTS